MTFWYMVKSDTGNVIKTFGELSMKVRVSAIPRNLLGILDVAAAVCKWWQ
jgi:hypothetical protein